MPRKPKLPSAADFFAGGDSVKQQGGKTVKRQKVQTSEEPDVSGEAVQGSPPRTVDSGFTEKVTFYLPPNLLKTLELSRVQVLLDHNLKASRSQVVQVIVEEMIQNTDRIAALLEEYAEG